MPTKEEIFEHLSNLSLADLSALMAGIEDKWGVIAAPTAAPGPAAGPAAEVVEQDEFTLILKASGASKINVIKVVREITGLGLKDAKDLVDGAPKEVKAGLKKADAEDLAKKLKEAGAEVELK